MCIVEQMDTTIELEPAAVERLCFRCGDPVSEHATRCPKCHSRPFLDRSEPTRDVDGLSILALVLSVGWFFWVGSLVGLVLGYARLRVIDAQPDERWGRPLASGAVVAGWAGLGSLVLAGLYLGLRLAFHYLVD